MEQVKTPDFEKRPPDEQIFWTQDAKADATPQAISAGCLITARYRGVTVTIRVEGSAGESITGVVDRFDTKGAGHPDGLAVGDRVRLSPGQVLSCGCVAVS